MNVDKVSYEEENIEELAIENVPYENLLKQYCTEIGWNWELLAALCYEESHFNTFAHSHSGARGLMQLMPKTAKRFGLNDSTIYVAEDNIHAGVEYIKHLQKTYSFISNKKEQENFIIASYNAGPAHIMDARRLAKKYGKSAYIWFDNTEYWLEQLNEPIYYNDSVVRFGQFNSKETVNHVRKVRRTEKRISKIE